MHAACFDLGGLGVFILVDHVLVEALVHQLVDLGLRPGLAESRQILPGVTIEHQLVMDHAIGVTGSMLAFRKFILRHADREIIGSINVIQKIVANVVFRMQGHGLLSSVF